MKRFEIRLVDSDGRKLFETLKNKTFPESNTLYAIFDTYMDEYHPRKLFVTSPHRSVEFVQNNLFLKTFCDVLNKDHQRYIDEVISYCK